MRGSSIMDRISEIFWLLVVCTLCSPTIDGFELFCGIGEKEDAVVLRRKTMNNTRRVCMVGTENFFMISLHL
jgi:hypothetical protein